MKLKYFCINQEKYSNHYDAMKLIEVSLKNDNLLNDILLLKDNDDNKIIDKVYNIFDSLDFNQSATKTLEKLYKGFLMKHVYNILHHKVEENYIKI